MTLKQQLLENGWTRLTDGVFAKNGVVITAPNTKNDCYMAHALGESFPLALHGLDHVEDICTRTRNTLHYPAKQCPPPERPAPDSPCTTGPMEAIQKSKDSLQKDHDRMVAYMNSANLSQAQRSICRIQKEVLALLRDVVSERWEVMETERQDQLDQEK